MLPRENVAFGKRITMDFGLESIKEFWIESIIFTKYEPNLSVSG